MPAPACNAPIAPTLMIRPAVEAVRCGIAAREALSAVVTLSAYMRCQVLGSPSATASNAKPPAMLISASSLPKCDAAASIAFLAWAASVRAPPPSSSWSGVAGTWVGAWSTLAPPAPRTSASSTTTRPSAPSAPVTTITFPSIICPPVGLNVRMKTGCLARKNCFQSFSPIVALTTGQAYGRNFHAWRHAAGYRGFQAPAAAFGAKPEAAKHHDRRVWVLVDVGHAPGGAVSRPARADVEERVWHPVHGRVRQTDDQRDQPGRR